MTRVINGIRIEEHTDQLYIRFPFALKDLFRASFKTSKWDSSAKAWTVKATTANKNKVAAWSATAEGAAADAVTLEETPFAEADLAKLRRDVARARQDIAAQRERAAAARAESARLTALFIELRKEVEAVRSDAAAAADELHAARQPALALCDELGVGAAIRTLAWFARKSIVLKADKGEFYAACQKLDAAHAEILGRLELNVPGLKLLGDVSVNRLDRLRELLALYEDDVLRGIDAD
ncbi:hypothetical protein OKW30_003558 [Paraburkholderia sp. Clong3]|uniref:hypothetical protein n=1 Tax=Paraburkholderia sp. Clong3 TaxID=2991061 RepID=UPI003D1BB51B